MHQRTNITHPDDVEILLVEDDRDDAEAVVEALHKNQVSGNILHLTNGSDALDYLASRGRFVDTRQRAKPRLILLDLKLPGTDGLSVLRSIKANSRTRAIPVIVISSTAHARDILECYQLGISSFLVKPASLVEYEQEVGQLEVHKLLHHPRS